MLAGCERLNGFLLACVVAAFSLQANGARLPGAALADEDSLLQVRLDVEEDEALRRKAPVCQKSLLTDTCSGYRYRSALDEYRDEIERHGALLKALEKQSPKAKYVEQVAPHISALLQDLSSARARLAEALETLPSNTTVALDAQAPKAAVKRQASSKNPVAVGLAPVRLMAVKPDSFDVDLADENLDLDMALNATEDEPLPPEAIAPPKKAKHRSGHLWIALVFIGLAVVLFCLMMMVVSVLRIQDDEAKTKADSKLPASGAQPSKFIQVALPYWLPTEPSSRGYLWIFLFLVLMAMSAALAFWVCAAFLLISHNIWPDLVKHTTTSWLRSTGLRAASVVVFGVGPAIFFSLRKKLEGRWQQWILLGARMFVMLLVNMWNVTSTFIERASQDALYFKDIDTFWVTIRLLFAGYTIYACLHMIEHLLTGLLTFKWRAHLTKQIFEEYMAQRQYYALESTYRAVDNPDQRIQEDAHQVAFLSLSLGLSTIGSILSLLSFALVLWKLMPMLTFTCMGYAVFGTIVTLWFTWQMAKLTYFSHRAEADFRFQLMHVRNNSEAIAFYRGEEREKAIALGRLSTAMDVLYRRLTWEVTSHGFTMYYGMASHIVPCFVIARGYFNGALDFGAFGQANIAFFNTLQSLNFVVNDKSMICNLTTAVNRVGLLHAAIHRPAEEVGGITCLSEQTTGVKIKDLTATVPATTQTIVRSLSLSAGQGGKNNNEARVRILLSGPSGVGKSSLLRVIAGLWTSGEGEVVRPPDEECMFLPQRPYMPQGNLRTQLLYPIESSSSKSGVLFSDCDLRGMLEHVGLEALPDRFEGGFDAVCDWARVLSLGEQQRVAAIRCFLRQPKLTVLDEATSALSVADENRLYEHFRKLNFSYISVGHRDSLIPYHDSVLELKGKGDWQYLSAEEFRIKATKGNSSM